jgi:hypothetical protein
MPGRELCHWEQRSMIECTEIAAAGFVARFAAVDAAMILFGALDVRDVC